MFWKPQNRRRSVGCRRGKRFGVSADEFASWERHLEKHGVASLRVTRSPDEKPQRRKIKARAVAVVPVTAEDWDYAGDWQARRAVMRARFG